MSNAEPIDPASGVALRSGLLRWPGAELDLRAAQVRRGGVVLALDRSSYEVLLALLLRAGQVLSKDDLLDAAWPGRVVSENSLAKAISRLRRELGDAAAAPLQSVHGYGYRWAGDVQWVELDRGPAVDADRAGAARVRSWIGLEVPHRHGWIFRRELGRGGHAVVLLAESVQGDPPRALKLALDEEGLRHIRREVALHRYLAALDRRVPGLAPALGWQLETPPVFVEYPYFEEGDLTRWMQARRAGIGVPLEARIAIVAQLAETLGELHAAGVVHQDLKPGNVFLTADPSRPEGWRTSLADLGGGHASPLPQLVEGDFDAAAFGAATPSDRRRADTAIYCAPEVLAGALPTQRSDTFSLGVLLYQMVVGDLRRPLAPGWEADVDDPLLRDDIRALAALRPEERVLTPAQLAQHLRCLPERRVAWIEAREAEGRRRDVEAELQRQRLRLRLLGVASGALFAGLALASWAGWLAWEARRDEQHRREEAQAVLGFLTDDVLVGNDPYRRGARDVSLRDALDEAASRIDERFGGSPETAAAVHEAIAGAFEGWGEYAKAADQRRATIGLLTSAAGHHAREIPDLQRGLCDLERRAGRLDAAQDACDTAAAHDLRVDGRVSDASLVAQAKLDYERGRCGAALTALRPLLDAPDAGRRLPEHLRADALWFVGLCHARLAEDAAAIRAFRALLGLQAQREDAGRPDAVRALADFADVLLQSGRIDEAEQVVERLARALEDRVAAEHPEAFVVAYKRGQVAVGRGQDEAAVAHFAAAYSGWSEALGRDHPLTLSAGSLLAYAQARAGRGGEATTVLARQQLGGARATPGQPILAAELHEIWAHTLLLLRRPDDAEAELRAFDSAANGLLPAAHPRRAAARCLESWVDSQRGNAISAGEALAACRIGLARLPPDHHRRRALADAERAIDGEAS